MAKVASDTLVLRVHPRVGRRVRELADSQQRSISYTGETLLQLALDSLDGQDALTGDGDE
jgi:hypothetical protein